jgi:hypothetical protein
LGQTSTSQDGYTLIELMLYVGIVGFLLGAAVAFFGVVGDARVKNQSVGELNDQGTFVMDYLTYALRNGTSITSPAVGGSSSQLTVVVPTGIQSPTVFSVVNGVLQMKEGAAPAVALTNSKVQVINFTVKNLTRSGTPGLAQVSVTLGRVNPTGRNEYSFERTFITSAGVRP